MRLSSIGSRLGSLLLVICLLFPLGGCMLQTKNTGPVTLRIAYRPLVADLAPLIAIFERDNPTITVETFEATPDNLLSLTAELNAGTLDVVRDNRSTMSNFVRIGAFAPLNGMMEAGDWGTIRQDYFTGSWEGLQVDGQQFAVPAGLDPYVAYVNLDAFTAAGVQPPSADWTIDDLLLLAGQVNQPKGTPGETQGVIYGFGTSYMSVDPIIFTYLHGGSIVDDFDYPRTVQFDDPKTVEATSWYANLTLKYKVSPKAGLVGAYFPYNGIYDAENQGFCAIWFSPFSSRGGPETAKWQFKWEMLPLPHDVQAISVGDVDGYYIPASSKHPQEALKLIRYLSDQWQESGVRFPVRKSMAANPSYQQQVGVESARIGSLAVENLVVIPTFYWRYQLDQVVQDYYDAVFKIISSDADPQAQLEAAQKTAEARLLQKE